jgi:hypothetical protein
MRSPWASPSPFFEGFETVTYESVFVFFGGMAVLLAAQSIALMLYFTTCRSE